MRHGLLGVRLNANWLAARFRICTTTTTTTITTLPSPFGLLQRKLRRMSVLMILEKRILLAPIDYTRDMPLPIRKNELIIHNNNSNETALQICQDRKRKEGFCEMREKH